MPQKLPRSKTEAWFMAIQKKLSNWIYVILRAHVFLPSIDEHILFDSCKFIIITVAFNSVETLQIQWKFLKENLRDEFCFIIADNSSNKDQSEKIKLFCRQNIISYVKIPWNPLTGIRASGSHGIALNWAYRNIVKKFKPAFFGFLDHDLFPILPTTIIHEIEKGFFGVIRTPRFQESSPYWYLWPGFLFSTFENTRKYRFDFSPHHTGPGNLVFLDTGGTNYNTIFKKMERARVSNVPTRIINMDTQRELQKGEDSSHTFELIGSFWFHIRQISWRTESFDKVTNLDHMIELGRKILDPEVRP